MLLNGLGAAVLGPVDDYCVPLGCRDNQRLQNKMLHGRFFMSTLNSPPGFTKLTFIFQMVVLDNIPEYCLYFIALVAFSPYILPKIHIL